MLSEARAERLARRAERGTADGSRRLLARRAWQRLTAAGDRGDQSAIEAVWQAWLRRPADDLWRVLVRWRGPQALAEAAFAAAMDPDRGPGERAGIGAFCTRHGLAPDGAIRRALFRVLTGQAAQHRAADPAGSLLASAYRTAGPATRAALREAIADACDLDLVCVVAGPSRAQHITAEEREYLTSQLAGHRDWDRLWRLVKGLPLAHAVAAMPLFSERWRPDGDRDRALFDQLNYPDARALAAARGALTLSIVKHIGLDDQAVAGSFSPDGRRLAVATHYDQRVRDARPDPRRTALAGRIRGPPPAGCRRCRDRLPFLVLLRACLEYRFGTDDGIDPATWLSDEEYDVALGRLT